MELVRRVTLHYQAGNSDKVYEVDLCRVAEGQYLVNFRYGRRGKSLKEGSKTLQAVALKEAERIFNGLVADKKKKGYWDVNDLEATTGTESSNVAEKVAISNNPRHQAIINRLARQDERKWSLDRVIWRVGELKIKEAVPFLVQLISTGKPLRNYCLAWALGQCGDKGAIPLLKVLAEEKSHPEYVNRIAWEALYRLSDEGEQAELRSQKLRKLPLVLRDLAEKGTTESFTNALQAYLDTGDYQKFQVLDTLYQIDNEYIRPALLKILKEAPLQPNYFKQLRHIFKMAEYRCDAEVFAILAYRFEVNFGTFKNRKVWQYDHDLRRYFRGKKRSFTEELQKPNSNRAYSEQTREYLRRRVWRTLKGLGEESDANYVNLATETLLQYSDADAERIKHSVKRKYNYQTGEYTTTELYWDAYARRIILNHILYENSPRYQPHPQAWRYRGDYQPGNSLTTAREEAFPELWDKQPTALLKLLLASKCLPVHEFAVKALKENQVFCDRLEIPTLIQLLGATYEITAEFAFHLTSDRYNPQLPDRELVLAVANCILSTAREQAYQWIEAQREYFFSSSNFIASLVTSHNPDTRAFARKLLNSSILKEETAQIIIARIITALLDFDITQNEIAQEIGETLLLSFTPQLRTLGFNIILDLLDHPLPAIQVLAARILLNHETPATELPPDLIESLLSSPHDSVRGVGIRIFGQLSDERLMSDRVFIIAMAVNSSAEIRQAIHPVIERLAHNHPDFGYEIAIDLIDLLLEPERHEGVHKDLLLILRSQMIPNWIERVDVDKATQLTRAKSPIAQELGGIILQANRDRFWSLLTTDQLVQLANCEILTIRQAAWQMMELKLDSILDDEDEMLSAIKMLEAKWEDSQEFAQSLFNKLNTEDWTPKIIIGICDSTNEEVRRFGRDLAISNFQPEYGQEYLLKFSEHPSADMQMFVTNYLESYAVDNGEKLQTLIPYFVTVLSGVNKGGVAKKRIFQFLEREATKNEVTAKIVAEILTRQSATIAIADKAAAIQIMLKIKKQYPYIEMPIEVKEVVVRR